MAVLKGAWFIVILTRTKCEKSCFEEVKVCFDVYGFDVYGRSKGPFNRGTGRLHDGGLSYSQDESEEPLRPECCPSARTFADFGDSFLRPPVTPQRGFVPRIPLRPPGSVPGGKLRGSASMSHPAQSLLLGCPGSPPWPGCPTGRPRTGSMRRLWVSPSTPEPPTAPGPGRVTNFV